MPGMRKGEKGDKVKQLCCAQTWNLSKSLHRQGFLDEHFTRNSINYKKCPITTKQQKNVILTLGKLGKLTMDKFSKDILPR